MKFHYFVRKSTTHVTYPFSPQYSTRGTNFDTLRNTAFQECQGTKWVRLASNGTNPGLFHTRFQYILARWAIWCLPNLTPCVIYMLCWLQLATPPQNVACMTPQVFYAVSNYYSQQVGHTSNYNYSYLHICHVFTYKRFKLKQFSLIIIGFNIEVQSLLL